MTRKYNEQEEFWVDDFSDSYIGGKKTPPWLPRVFLFLHRHSLMLKISTPVTVDSREHSDCILKRAVAGEMLDLYRSLKL